MNFKRIFLNSLVSKREAGKCSQCTVTAAHMKEGGIYCSWRWTGGNDKGHLGSI